MPRRRPFLWLLLILALAAGPAQARTAQEGAEPPAAGEDPEYVEPELPEIEWQRSRSIGLPWAGRLEKGVRFPAEASVWFTWDPVRRTRPNRSWRRWGSDRLVETLVDVLVEFAAEHPYAPRVGVGDLSRPKGGPFGRRYGGLGHMSHQNGLDADVYYPRTDGLERAPREAEQVDLALAQDLVDRFVEAGAVRVYVGPNLDLHGPRKVVIPLVHHDDHLHVRLRSPRR